MAGFLSVANNNVYHSFINDEEEVPNGVFVTPNYTTGTATLSKAGDTDYYFVHNENENAPEWGIDDVDYVTKKGKFLRATKPSVGEVYVTTIFEEGLTKGDPASVGANGEIVAGGEGFVVQGTTTAYGSPAVSLLYVGTGDSTP